MIYSASFFVAGRPQQKGSKRPFVFRRRGVPEKAPWREKYGASVVDMNQKNSEAWEQRIRLAAMPFVPMAPMTCAFKIDVQFYFARGKTVTRSNHTVPPDRDKLLRCVQDALEGMIWKNDSQIVAGTTSKEYGTPEGARIQICSVGEVSDQMGLQI
jgi:Holliday junction resolvase RusA-like endonuclease